MIKELRLKLIGSWKTIFFYLVGAGTLLFLLLFRLGSLTSGLSGNETTFLAGTKDIAAIGDNPINAPYKLLEWVLHYFDQTSPLAVRSVSIFFGVASVALFFYLISTWHTPRIAALAAVLFTSSAWFLHIARQSTPDILLVFTVVSFLAYGTWFKLTKKSNLALLVGSLLLALSVYIPGVIWLLIIGMFWQRKKMFTVFKSANLFIRLLAILICAASIIPLAWAAALDSHVVRSIIGLPLETSFAVKETFLSLLRVPVRLFYQGPANASFWLGQLPLLGIFASIMSCIGVYAYYFRLKLDRTKALWGLLIVSSVLSSLGRQTSLALLLPIMYIIVAGGITLLLQQWLTVFPRNPLARGIGRGLITVVIILAAFYNINQYFVAWPNSPETKTAFTNQQR